MRQIENNRQENRLVVPRQRFAIGDLSLWATLMITLIYMGIEKLTSKETIIEPITTFPEKCLEMCYPCNYNTCWLSCDCDRCTSCLISQTATHTNLVTRSPFPHSCKEKCRECDFNQCWKECTCYDCAVCLTHIYPTMDFFK